MAGVLVEEECAMVTSREGSVNGDAACRASIARNDRPRAHASLAYNRSVGLPDLQAAFRSLSQVRQAPCRVASPSQVLAALNEGAV